MRILPFMKRKNGIQFAGVGIDTGGGGGGGGSSIVLSEIPTKIGKYGNDDLYAVVIPVPGDITTSARSYIEKEFNVDKIKTLSARYTHVVHTTGDETQGVDGVLYGFGGVLLTAVYLSYQYYENKDCFIYEVSNLTTGDKLTDFEIIATFTKGD